MRIGFQKFVHYGFDLAVMRTKPNQVTLCFAQIKFRIFYLLSKQIRVQKGNVPIVLTMDNQRWHSNVVSIIVDGFDVIYEATAGTHIGEQAR